MWPYSFFSICVLSDIIYVSCCVPELENAVSAGLHGYQKRGPSQISSFAILFFGLKAKCSIASALLRYKTTS